MIVYTAYSKIIKIFTYFDQVFYYVKRIFSCSCIHLAFVTAL